MMKSPDGLTPEQRYRLRHPDRVRAAQERYKLGNGDKIRAAQAAWRTRNPDKVRASLKRWHAVNIERGMFIAAKKRAKKRNLQFTITLADVALPDICPVLGIPLVASRRGKGGRTHNSPSLDRLDSAKGYIPGNVWVISWRANDLKGNATVVELEKVLRAWKARL